jgi:hypothetical protein
MFNDITWMIVFLCVPVLVAMIAGAIAGKTESIWAWIGGAIAWVFGIAVSLGWLAANLRMGSDEAVLAWIAIWMLWIIGSPVAAAVSYDKT